MKLSKIYSNQSKIFPPITFNDGFNVIYAEVTKPKDKSEDSHNLGKTLLIHLLDFMLLKEFGKGLFLYDNKSRFNDFSFFLELALHKGQFLTIRRDVNLASKVWIHEHSKSKQDYSALSDDDWSYKKLAFKKGKKKLDQLIQLQLSLNSPWNYRTGCGYFLRTQSDYLDVFKLAKFTSSKHMQWKPFLAKLLGFDDGLILQKYELDGEENELEKNREFSRELTSVETTEYDRVKGTLEIKREELTEATGEVERFNFYKSDLELNSELLEKLEKEIAVLNDQRYTVGFELGKIQESIQSKTTFDIDKVAQLFEEAGTAFPSSVKRNYDELLDFNKRISEERSARLTEQRQRLLDEQKTVNQDLSVLNKKREELLTVLQDTDTLNKYRRIQRNLTTLEASIAKLEVELEQLDKVAAIDKKIQTVVNQKAEVVGKIQEAVNEGNERYANVRTEFNRIVKRIMGVPAVLSISLNQKGNLEFEASLLKSETRLVPTSEDKGNSYRQLLCSAFDLSLLSEYSDDSFYRFVYHDGVLESLDERKKRQLLEVVHELCANKGIQYIMTLIDADMPRDENDKRIPFQDSEIVRHLHDGSDEGRLFKMETF